MKRKLRLALILLLGVAVPAAMQIIGIPDRDHGGFLWAFAERLVLLPLCVILMNLLAGRDVKHFWATPLLPIVFCLQHLLRGGSPNWIWLAGYLALGITVLVVTAAARKRKCSETEEST